MSPLKAAALKYISFVVISLTSTGIKLQVGKKVGWAFESRRQTSYLSCGDSEYPRTLLCQGRGSVHLFLLLRGQNNT